MNGIKYGGTDVRNQRTIGQRFRNLRDVDPWTRLCMAALSRATGDAHAIAERAQYQPGIRNNDAALEREKQELRTWVTGEQFRTWCLYLGENVDERREEIERILADAS